MNENWLQQEIQKKVTKSAKTVLVAVCRVMQVRFKHKVV